MLDIFKRRHAGPALAPAPFIIGAPRSGTTLLRLMLDAHPELSIPPETGFLPDVARLRGRGSVLQRSFLEKVTADPGWSDAHISRKEFEQALNDLEPFTVPTAVRMFYQMYATRFGKKRWGDKTPSYCLHIDRIQEVLPEARFIHIVRDGRDVALSLEGLWFSPESIEARAELWRTWVRTARRRSARNPNYIEVRYEDLIADAPLVLKKICRFINLDYDSRMERYFESSPARLDEINTVYRADGTTLITKEERLYNHRFVTLPLEPSRVARWRIEMDTATQMRFSKVAGDLLTELGY